MSVEQLTALIVAIGGLGGLWKYLESKSKQAHERALKLEEDRAEFNDTLRDQVDSLSKKVDQLLDERQQLMSAIADLKSDLAAAKATIAHFEDIIRLRAMDINGLPGTPNRRKGD